jgi:hypothetical protein
MPTPNDETIFSDAAALPASARAAFLDRAFAADAMLENHEAEEK